MALGGNHDRSGCVKRSHIIDIIKNVFELTFDIEKFMDQKSIESEELTYFEFMSLFESNEESKSVISFLSKGDQDQIYKTFNISYKNYPAWRQ